MSRSRKHTPIHGHTCKESDKPFKVIEHRRERRIVRASISIDSDMPHPKTFGNPWASCKDGKSYWEGDGGYKVMMK